MTDVRSTLLSTPAPLPVKAGSRILRSQLVIRCTPKQPAELIFDLDHPIASSSGGQARIRFDTAPPRTVRGELGATGKALFLPSAASLIKSLMSAKEFRVEVTPVGNPPMITAFLVGDLTDHKAALAACGIK